MISIFNFVATVASVYVGEGPTISHLQELHKIRIVDKWRRQERISPMDRPIHYSTATGSTSFLRFKLPSITRQPIGSSDAASPIPGGKYNNTDQCYRRFGCVVYLLITCHIKPSTPGRCRTRDTANLRVSCASRAPYFDAGMPQRILE